MLSFYLSTARNCLKAACCYTLTRVMLLLCTSQIVASVLLFCSISLDQFFWENSYILPERLRDCCPGVRRHEALQRGVRHTRPLVDAKCFSCCLSVSSLLFFLFSFFLFFFLRINLVSVCWRASLVSGRHSKRTRRCCALCSACSGLWYRLELSQFCWQET